MGINGSAYRTRKDQVRATASSRAQVLDILHTVFASLISVKFRKVEIDSGSN